MAFGLQLRDVQADPEIKDVSGVCGDSVKFISQVNTVTRQLWKRGCWYGVEVLMRFCVQGCSVTYPRHVHAINGIRACGRQHAVRNNWYEIAGPACDGFGSISTLTDDGLYPCYNEVSGTTGKKIAYHVVKNADIGKTITIYGFKYGGQPLQEKDADGNWKDGVTIAAISAGGTPGDPGTVLPAMTTELVTKITHITREATQGMTYLYEYDTTEDTLRDLAVYEPTETTPQYRRMKLNNPRAIVECTDSNGRKLRKIEAMAKLQFVPVSSVYDFLLIDDLDALRYGIQALRKDQAGEVEQAEAFWIKAVRELNHLERSRNADQTLTVKVNALGGGMIANPI